MPTSSTKGFSTSDWLLDHRGDFELLVVKKIGDEKAANIDWSSPRLLFIAGDFYKYDITTSTDIYKHSDQWISQMRRLKRLGCRPDRCLITARTPKDETDHPGAAFRQIRASSPKTAGKFSFR
jgi:hypothetical protein